MNTTIKTIISALTIVAIHAASAEGNLALPGTAFDADRAQALVIGINDYQDAGIRDNRFAVSDSRAVSDALQAAGWNSDTIIALEDAGASKGTIQSAFGALANRAARLRQKTGRGMQTTVVYFSGHGFVGDKASTPEAIVPYDARTGHGSWEIRGGSTPRVVNSTVITWDYLAARAAEIDTENLVFIIDACNASNVNIDSLMRETRKASVDGVPVGHLPIAEGLRPIVIRKRQMTPARQVALYTAAGLTTAEANGQGVFTKAVVDALAAGEPGTLNVEELELGVRRQYIRNGYLDFPVLKVWSNGYATPIQLGHVAPRAAASATAKAGTTIVVDTPVDGTVYVNGSVRGTTRNGMLRIPVEAGRYQVTVVIEKSAGRHVHFEEAIVSAGDQWPVTVTPAREFKGKVVKHTTTAAKGKSVRSATAVTSVPKVIAPAASSQATVWSKVDSNGITIRRRTTHLVTDRGNFEIASSVEADGSIKRVRTIR